MIFTNQALALFPPALGQAIAHTQRARQELVEEIWVEKEALQDEDVRKAFEKALQDICDGLLPLGGGTNRGNGIFIGTLNIQE